MTQGSRGQPPADSLRAEAVRRMEEITPVDLAALTPDEIQALVYELEVHRVELKLQNDQLLEAQRSAEVSNERFRRLYDSAPSGYLTLATDGEITEANLSISQMLGTPRSQLIGANFAEFVAAHCQDRWYLARRGLIDGRTPTDLMLELGATGGALLDVQIVGTLLAREAGSVAEIHLALLDVTELRRTERALQAAVAAAAMSEERERRKLAADLHDDAGQLLALASLKLHALADAGEMDRRNQIVALDDLLVEIRRRISSLSFQLSPPLLHDLGLTAALQWLAEDLMKTHGLSVKIVEERELELDENVRSTFYRAVRELLINVVKHAGVKQARVTISKEGGMACIGVEDAGRGMPPRGKRYGFGLLALRERVEQLGGSLETRGTPGSGTTVMVRLPTPHDIRGGER